MELPKFRLTWQRRLNEDLAALGIRTAFQDGTADFSRMVSGGGVFIDFVQHNTFVDVHEEGTEAAAVTVVANSPETSRVVAGCLCVHGPFVFAIRERFSGTILFIGKVVRVP